MIETPHIVEIAARPIAVIHLTIPRDQIQHVMGPGIQELTAGVAAQGIAITGPWFTHHLRIAPEQFDFEIGVPVASPVQPTGRIQPGQWPAMRVARTVMHGNYDGLPSAWPEFDAWIGAQGHTPAPDLWEVYTQGPESSPHAADWRTELNRPLAA